MAERFVSQPAAECGVFKNIFRDPYIRVEVLKFNFGKVYNFLVSLGF
jgi:hypothetical protein